jgi:hypothetical protein
LAAQREVFYEKREIGIDLRGIIPIFTPMKTKTKSLVEIRNYLAALLQMTPDEATDSLTNNGEDVLREFNHHLGKRAFAIGDKVLAYLEQSEEFDGSIVGIKKHKNRIIFDVKDQDNNVFGCYAEELSPL